ncbi:MAG: leucine-rich repeat domain-containing protein [Bacteroidales bacterium]
MKQKLLFMLCIMQLISPLAILADTVTVDNLKYEINDTNMTASVTGYETKPTGELVIPATITVDSKEYSVTSIYSSTSSDTGAFYKCSSITSVVLPNSLTSIGDYAFRSCFALKSINLPESLTDIGKVAFMYCDGLTSFNIPNSVTFIGDSAMFYCDALQSVTISGAIEYIGDYAFATCHALNSVKIYAEIPPEITTTVFNNIYTDFYSIITLTVPIGCVDIYKADAVWGLFTNIVEGDYTDVEYNLVDETKLYVTNNGILNISGATDGAIVKVYSISGVNVANGVIIDSTAQIELPITKGIYIVTIGNKSYKVIR